MYSVRWMLADGPLDSEPVRITIPATSTVVAPADFLAGHAQSTVLAVGTGGTFVAGLTSTSLSGTGYAVAAGVPIPNRWIPADRP